MHGAFLGILHVTRGGTEAPSTSHIMLLMASMGLKFKAPNKVNFCRFKVVVMFILPSIDVTDCQL